MRFRSIDPKEATRELIKYRPLRNEMDLFKGNLSHLLDNIDSDEREEHLKNNIRDFLLDTFYKDTNFINTKDAKDLVIHNGKTNKESVGVIIEAKRPGNKGEMLSIEKPNTKALHELVLYYMEERITGNNIDIKHCIATNIYEWFIIDAQYFEKFFARNKGFVKQYQEWKAGQKVTKDTALFYNDIVKPFVDSLDEVMDVAYFDIRTYEKELKGTNKVNDKKLISLYKIQSPYHLLRKSSVDSNTLNDKFYKELLYIIGLEEAKDGGKSIIRRRQDRNAGSLIENTITRLEEGDLYRITGLNQYGKDKEERIFNIALELALTWINRILFLKLLEGQLVNYHRGDQEYRFLDARNIHDFDELHKLFHLVLARTYSERKEDVKEKYKNVPYLNSSLFEKSELENQAVAINQLENNLTLALMPNSVLQDKNKKNESLRSIDYIFRFLDAYDFASDGKDDIQEDSKALISASVLGKVFEKINGYKDGSIYTPGFITMYMCKEAIRKSVVQKFNEHYGWQCDTIDAVHNKIENINEANNIINSIKICDPAVGSGHFLVSALNEIIAIKAELHILQDENGKRIKEYDIDIINDELVILDEYNDPFIYNPNNRESQRIQKTLFNEKKKIIENCLFGVDINVNSVKICRLRLWIELLKNAYYIDIGAHQELETLPNIDINIKSGNSLLSRYALHTDLTLALKNVNHTIPEYRKAVYDFKNATDREEKYKLTTLINDIKNGFQTYFSIHDDRRDKLSKARGELIKLQSETLFESTKGNLTIKKKIETLNARIKKLENEIEEIKNNVVYQTAFEWRFEFPEVLDDNGNFEGFDVLIGNPPYIQLQKMGESADILQQQDYRTFVRTGDIYCLFYEQGIRLLKPNGYLAYITSNKWMRASYGESMRDFFITDSNPLQLIDFVNLQLFDAATVNTNILITQKASYSGEVQTCSIEENVNSLKNMSDYFRLHATISTSFEVGKNWAILSPVEMQLKRKVEESGVQLKHWDIQINRGILTGFNEAFIISEETKNSLISKSPKNAEIIRPILKGRNIRKYIANDHSLWIIHAHNGLKKFNIPRVDINDYPAVLSHLEQYKVQLVKRQDKGDYWTNLRNCAYLKEFDKEKIVWLELTDLPKFAYDNTGIMVEATGFIMTGESMKFLTAFLNSKLCEWYFDKITTTSGVGTNRWKKIYIESLPIPKISSEQQASFVKYIDEIIAITQSGESIKDLEDAIDEDVYKLYGFGEIEINILKRGIK